MRELQYAKACLISTEMGVEMQTFANTSHEDNLLVYFHKRALTSAKFGVVTYPVIKCRRTIIFIPARHGAATRKLAG